MPADEELNWNFSLQDEISKPVHDMVAALNTMTKALKDAAGELADVEGSVQKTGRGVESAGGSFKDFALTLDATLGIIGKVGGALWDLGSLAGKGIFDFEKEAIGALDFKETTLASLQVLLGSAKEAQEFFQNAAWLGKATPFQTKDVVESYKRLLSAGFSKEEVPIVFQALGDASAMTGFDPQVISRMTHTFAEIMAQGFNGRTMRMALIDAAGSGLSATKMDEELAKQLGVSPDQVQGMVETGGVAGRTAIQAMVNVLRDTAGGGIIGGGMVAQADTFSGIMSTLESTFSDFFLTLDGSASDVKGFGVLKGALMNMREALDTTTPAGKRLQATVVGAFDSMTTSLFGVLNGPDGLAMMETFVTKIATGVEDFGKLAGVGFDAAEAGILSFADALGLTKNSVTGLFDGPLTKEKIDVLRTQLVEMAKEGGTELAKFAKALAEIAGSLDHISATINVIRSVDDYGRNAIIGVRNLGLAFQGKQEGYYLTSTHKQATLDLDGNPLSGTPAMPSDVATQSLAKQPGAPAAMPFHVGGVTVNVYPQGGEPRDHADATADALSRVLEEHSRKMSVQGGSH